MFEVNVKFVFDKLIKAAIDGWCIHLLKHLLVSEI